VTFLAAPALFALALLPIIVVLYFLQERRRPRPVSAGWLWEKALRESRRRSRARFTLLLLLQILAVLFMVLAAARPALLVAGGSEVVIVFDASASMLATDVQPSRFDSALAGARRVAGSSERVWVIRAGLAPRLAAAPDGARWEDALARLSPGDAAADLTGSLDLAAQVAPGAETIVFTDQARPDAVAGNLRWVRVAGRGENVGIVAFSIGSAGAFVALAGALDRPRDATVAVFREGAEVGRATIRVPVEGEATALLPVPVETGRFEARIIDANGPDVLALDDRAFAARDPLRVLLAPISQPLVRALQLVPDVRLSVSETPPAAPRAGEVLVLESIVPDNLPAGRYLITAGRAPPGQPTVGIADWNRDHPIMRFVDLSPVNARINPAPPPGAGAWRTLAITADLRPYISVLDSGEVQAVYIHSSLADTDLERRPAFPILVLNVIRYFQSGDQVRLGEVLPVEGRITRDGAVIAAGLPVDRPGIYEATARTFAANLLEPEQTRLPRGDPVDIAAVRLDDAVEVPRGIGLIAVALALAALLGEWWLRHQPGWAQ
jgi:hypothetical protein